MPATSLEYGVLQASVAVQAALKTAEHTCSMPELNVLMCIILQLQRKDIDMLEKLQPVVLSLY